MSQKINGTITASMTLGLCLLALVTGCKNQGQAKESKAVVSSMKETHEYLAKAANELEGTRALLDRLSSETDLKAWKAEYDKTVDKMQKAAAKARDQWLDMKHNGTAYIERWDQEIAETQSPTVKEGMEARRQRIGAAMDGLITSAQDLRDSYQPYVADLKDLQTALAIDLTPGGVRSQSAAIEKAKADGEVVAKKLDAVGQQLDKLAGRMSPTTSKSM